MVQLDKRCMTGGRHFQALKNCLWDTTRHPQHVCNRPNKTILQDMANKKTRFRCRVLSSYQMDKNHPLTTLNSRANKKSQQDMVRKTSWCHCPQLKNFQESKLRCQRRSCNLEDKTIQQGKGNKKAVYLSPPMNNCLKSKVPCP